MAKAPAIYKPTVNNWKMKALIYGPPGVGKTTLAASANDCDDMAPAVMVSVESGTLAVIESDTSPIKNPIDVIDYTGLDQLRETWEWLATAQHGYKTVILDTLSELQAKGLEDIVRLQLSKNAKRADQDEIWQEDYGRSTGQIRRICRAMRDLPMHVIFTCHDATQQDGASVFPALTPKVRQSVIGYVDLVGYLWTSDSGQKDENDNPILVRKMLAQPFGQYTAKDRTPGGRLGTVITSPTMSMIMDKIKGERTDNGKKRK